MFWGKMTLPNDKKTVQDTFYIVVWYILLVILFLHYLHRKQVLYWSLVFSLMLLIRIQGFTGEANYENMMGYSRL